MCEEKAAEHESEDRARKQAARRFAADDASQSQSSDAKLNSLISEVTVSKSEKSLI